MLQLFWSFFLLSFATWAVPSEVLVQPIGPTDEEHQQLQEEILKTPDLQGYLRNKTFRVLEFENDPLSIGDPYRLLISIESDSRIIQVTGPNHLNVRPQIQEVLDEVPASTEEFSRAVEILKNDSGLGPEIRGQRAKPYEPMPTTTRLPIGNRNKTSRLINVGLMSKEQPKWNEIVSVDLHSKNIFRYPNRAPGGAIAAEQTCGPPNANQRPTPKGRKGSAEIKIRRGNEIIWKFTVVRPSASSGRQGSGLELRNLFYKGRKVLNRAHTPILNVEYEGNRCGPFRDWAYSENAFEAHGYEKAPGILIAAHPPKTIFDTQNDRGQFQGVAIYMTEDKALLVTELSAGWYRYVSEFELYNDGRIKPSFKFSSVENSCVCFSHNHHVYWRFDFDVDGTRNSVHVSNGQTYTPIDKEVAQIKSPSTQSWRILNPQSAMGYDLMPGPYDGAADPYSLGDVWLLRHSLNEIDDSRVKKSTQAALPKFVTNQTIVNGDLVFWYSGHFIHSHDGEEARPAVVGPTLTPVNWPTAIGE